MNFTLEIHSKKYGRIAVTAPARFQGEILARRWHVYREPRRAEGRQFVAATTLTRKPGEKRRSITLHRFIWDLAGRPWSKHLDHVDGQPLNNAESNIRSATVSQNACNRGLTSTNTTGALGVHWRKDRKKWQAQVTFNYRKRHIGYFREFSDAVAARDAAAKRIQGDFARSNEPQHRLGVMA